VLAGAFSAGGDGGRRLPEHLAIGATHSGSDSTKNLETDTPCAYRGSQRLPNNRYL
jgi:hypothetical protein